MNQSNQPHPPAGTPTQLHLPAVTEVDGLTWLPGSKSISNRVLLLAALAGGTTEITHLLKSDDTDRMLDALQKLGIHTSRLYERSGAQRSSISLMLTRLGNFPREIDKDKDTNVDLFLGNAGTAFRPLTAALAFAQGTYTYTLRGSPRMHERPIKDLVDALRQVGANIEYLENDGFPPIQILPARIRVQQPIKIRGDVSSQFLTALLMALPLTKQAVSIEVEGELISKPYIEITLNLMQQFGVKVQNNGWQNFTIPANSQYTSPDRIQVEGDASSASYFLAAGAIAGGVTVVGIHRNSIQGDIKFADVLEVMGATITEQDLPVFEPFKGNYPRPRAVTCRKPASGKLKAITLDCNHIPDAAMTLAILALFAEGTTRLSNIASWRVKETDRISAMATELRKVGAIVEEGPDYITITPPAKLTPNAVIDTYDDHRMAMCFSLVSLGENGVPITINDPNCVAKTFPNYFTEFNKICMFPVIAIDGPSASGKGTVAQLVAARLGFHYLDSGATYRAVALAAQQANIDWADENALKGLVPKLDIEFDHNEIYLNHQNVTDEIRSEAISRGASEVAVHEFLRWELQDLQRSFRQAPGLVADGRDMATVFLDHSLKIFLTASAEVRAERRYKQLLAKNKTANYNDILSDLHQRDTLDKERVANPLKPSRDAILLDTTHKSIQEAVDFILSAYAESLRT